MQYSRVNFINDPRLGIWYRRVRSKPGWVWQLAIFAALLVVVLPIVLLTLAAVLVFAAVFTVCSLIAAGLGFARRLFSWGGSPDRPLPDHERENVRVIHRD